MFTTLLVLLLFPIEYLLLKKEQYSYTNDNLHIYICMNTRIDTVCLSYTVIKTQMIYNTRHKTFV